ncbi:hypothetical protein NL529_30210, partial [Klebsiella pneumoniae]|nr:hypothetical protein [Klebsiella pneumoniae]
APKTEEECFLWYKYLVKHKPVSFDHVFIPKKDLFPPSIYRQYNPKTQSEVKKEPKTEIVTVKQEQISPSMPDLEDHDTTEIITLERL